MLVMVLLHDAFSTYNMLKLMFWFLGCGACLVLNCGDR